MGSAYLTRSLQTLPKGLVMYLSMTLHRGYEKITLTEHQECSRSEIDSLIDDYRDSYRADIKDHRDIDGYGVVVVKYRFSGISYTRRMIITR